MLTMEAIISHIMEVIISDQSAIIIRSDLVIIASLPLLYHRLPEVLVKTGRSA